MRPKQFAVWVVLVSLYWGSSTKAQQGGSTTGSTGGVNGATVSQELGAAASGAVPRLINFSGVIKDPEGNVKTGAVTLTFSLYALQDGGSPLWVETQPVEPDSQGRYTVLLGSTNSDGLPLDLFTTGQARWLGIQHALPGIGELPRVLLVGVPYALKAADADTLAGRPASEYVLVESQSAPQTAAATLPTPPMNGQQPTRRGEQAVKQGASATPCSAVTSDAQQPPTT